MIETLRPGTEQYIQKHTPPHLQGKLDKTAWLSKIFAHINEKRIKNDQLKIIGKDNLPKKGPYLIICNHFGGRAANLFALDEEIRMVAGKAANWDRPIFKQVMLGIGALQATESFANLGKEEWEGLIERTPSIDKSIYEKVKDNQTNSFDRTKEVAQQLKSIVAVLANGGKVAIFPEGLKHWEDQLHKGYGGYVKIAELYERLTGERLTIVPVAMNEDAGKATVTVGNSFTFSKERNKAENADLGMFEIAKLLPEEKRGEYRDIPQ